MSVTYLFEFHLHGTAADMQARLASGGLSIASVEPLPSLLADAHYLSLQSTLVDVYVNVMFGLDDIASVSSATMLEQLLSDEAQEQFHWAYSWEQGVVTAIVAGRSIDDTLNGTAGNDTMLSLAGHDTLFGGAEDDTILGGSGADILHGEAGGDRLDGGAGFDIASYATSSTGVWVDLLRGTSSGGDAAGDTLTNIESLTGSAFADILTGTSANNALRGGGGNDILRPYQGGDFVDGGAGTDILDYSYTGVALNINMATNKVTRVDGFTGNGGYNQSVFNIEFIRATGGDDYIRSDINLALTIYGYGGNDIMIGFNGRDRLIGGDGNDRISGGNNNDLLYGQAGADQFYATNTMGRDDVMDWQDGLDRINMGSASGVNSFADINVSNGSKGAFVWWDADANGGGAANGFWLVGQSVATVDASDFIF